jgi:hypothetical protein
MSASDTMKWSVRGMPPSAGPPSDLDHTLMSIFFLSALDSSR